MSGHNNYYLWGPGNCTAEVLIYLGQTKIDDLKQGFDDVEQVAVRKCQYCMPFENNLPIFLCRGIKLPIKLAAGQVLSLTKERRQSMKGTQDHQRALAAYKSMTATYDSDAERAEALLGRLGLKPLRNRLIAQLHLQPGDVVVDVGCGTGLSFPLLEKGIGPGGRLLGVELSPDMLAKARERVAANGWENVTLIEAPAEEARLPVEADAVLFCLGHDIIRSPKAIANLLGQLKEGGRVVAGGTKWAPWWAVPVNLFVWSIAHEGVTTFEGFDRPWRYLKSYVPELEVKSLAGGGSYMAWGTVPAGK